MLCNQISFNLNYIQNPFNKGDVHIEKTYTQYTNNILCMLTKHLLSVEIYIHKRHLLHIVFVIVRLSFMFAAIYSYERFCLLCFKIWYSKIEDIMFLNFTEIEIYIGEFF